MRETEPLPASVANELGPLPKEWKLVRLGDLFEIQQGKALSPKARTGTRQRPFLRTANVFWGRIDLSVLDEMHFDEEEEQRLALLPRDLLVCEGGDIGRTAMWEGQVPLCLYQNHLHRLRATRSDVEPLFYMYWMHAAWKLLDLYGGSGNNTTIPNLSRSRLAAFAVPLPPLPEQRAIAHVLRTVQRAREATERVIAAARALKQSLLRYLFTYGPVPVDQADQVPLKETEIGPVPEHWEVVRLGDVATVGGPKPAPPTQQVVPFIPMSLIPDQGLYLTKWELKHRHEVRSGVVVRDGDLLLAKITPCFENGKQAILKGVPGGVGYATTEVFPIRTGQTLNVEFLSGHLRLASVREVLASKMEGTTGRQRLPKNSIEDLLIPLPPQDVQETIGSILHAIEDKIRAEEQHCIALDTLFNTLLHHLMTGKLRVTDLAQAVPGAGGEG